MTTSPAHLTRVGTWLNDLATLVAGSTPLAEIKTKIAAVAGLLAEDFPHRDTFTKTSLAAMAKEFTFFPSYAELVRHLNRWWDINRPKTIPLPEMDEDMPEPDRAIVRSWNEYRSGVKKLDCGNIEHWLSIIRKYAPAAFAYLCRTDTLAAAIASSKCWVSEPTPPPTPDEIAIVHAKVMEATARLSRTPTASA
jgi:hypothetical protein